MSSRVQVKSGAKEIIKTSGRSFSGAQLAKNVRAFISGIKKA